MTENVRGDYALAYIFLTLARKSLFLVHHAPDVGDIAEDERHEEGDKEHGAESELAAAAVDNGERTLEVGIGGIVGRVAEAGDEEKGENNQHHADAGRPDASDIGLADHGTPHPIEQEHHSNEREHSEQRHGEIVVEIFHRLHEDETRLRINGVSILQQQTHKEGEEKHEEGACSSHQTHACTRTDVLILHIVDDI